MMNLNERIGAELRSEREKRDLSLADVAKSMGYASRNTVSKIELGTTQITVEQLEKYCNALNINMYDFLRRVTNARLQG